jgi:hypothetical protein
MYGKKTAQHPLGLRPYSARYNQFPTKVTQ